MARPVLRPLASGLLSRSAVDAFVARLGAVNITSLVIDHTVMQYDPAGRRVQSSAEHRLYLKVPRRLRIERACEELDSGKMNVTEVALEVGYQSLSHFAKAFREETGESPSKWLGRQR